MTRTRIVRKAAIVVIAVAVCAALALREAVAGALGQGLDRRLVLDALHEELAWIALYYLMWAALTPLVFGLARRVPFRRERWVFPLVFHTAASVVIAVLAPLALSILFGGLVLGRGWPEPAGLLTPFWTRLAAYRAIADTSYYWVILGAGVALRVYDEYQAKQLEAAELARSLVAAQVDVLKMKLQPHFLFNTLNSIAFLALEKDSGAIVTMVGRLGSLLRGSMQADGRQFVPLEEELALLDDYLAIEEVRFGDRLHVARRIDPTVTRVLVPSMVLQPIIENSIKHGFSQRLDASRIEITIDRDRGALRIRVSDDGPGLPPGWDLATHCGRGLKNVIERLEALYRTGWYFNLADGDTGGTTAELRIPCTEPDGGPAPADRGPWGHRANAGVMSGRP